MIKRIRRDCPVYISMKTTDMRKSINGLAAIVQGSFQMDPYEGALFVFCNRRKDKLKVLFWDKDGFVLYYKRMEKGRFSYPQSDQSGAVRIGEEELERLLKGLVMEQFMERKNYNVY